MVLGRGGQFLVSEVCLCRVLVLSVTGRGDECLTLPPPEWGGLYPAAP